MPICPKCLKEVADGHFACVHSGNIGRIMTEKKRLALKRNAKSRWKGHKKEKALKEATEKKLIKEQVLSYYKSQPKPIK